MLFIVLIRFVNKFLIPDISYLLCPSYGSTTETTIFVMWDSYRICFALHIFGFSDLWDTETYLGKSFLVYSLTHYINHRHHETVGLIIHFIL